MDFDWILIGTRALFLIEAFVVLLIGKFIRDMILLRKGFRFDQQLTKDDNLAVAIDLAGFLLGLTIALLDALVIEGETLLTQSSEIAVTGIIMLSVLFLNSKLFDVFVLRKVDDQVAINEGRNSAVAMSRLGGAIATGLICRATFGQEATFMTCFVWALIGQVILIIMSFVYQLISPYDDLHEIREGNVAAALPLAGVLISVGMSVEGAIAGETESLMTDVSTIFGYLVICSVALILTRQAFKTFFISNADLDEEIIRDRNLGVGLLEATLYICVAEFVNFFLN